MKSALLCRLLLVCCLTGAAHAQVVDPSQRQAWREQAQAAEHGEGRSRDIPTAIDLYCRAALAGDAVSAYNLGWMYANGRGVARDDAIASHWFARAALLGDTHAEAMHQRLATPPNKPACVIEAENLAARLAARSAEQRRAEEEREAQATRYRALVDTPEERRIMKIVYRLAPQFGIAPGLAFAVIRAESNFDVHAVSPKNAQGLMQLIPDTAARFAVRKPFDPEQNIRGGLSYLRWLMSYFRGQVPLVLAAYNAGEGAVDRHGGIPPFPETRDYVRRIQAIYGLTEHPFDPALTEPSPLLQGSTAAR